MADEAFALSPISARAAQPSEQDYEAISDAFMETSRGRWFLGEYAKRNRNADTRMVLDAVARIEQNLAAQQQPPPDTGLAEALAAIRSALDEARAGALAALDHLALEENLAAVRKGARVIREISWRWREIGGDGRICDLLDSQVSAIEGACGQISSAGPRAALGAAFELIAQRIAGFDDGEMAAPHAAAPATRSPSPAPAEEMPAAVAEAAQAATENIEAVASTAVMPTEAAVASVEAVDASAEAGDVEAEVADITADADAHDEALLDMVAFEMAAPDPSDIEDVCFPDADDIRVAELPPAEPVMVAREPAPMAAPPPADQRSPEPPPPRSLGSTLIANGIVRRPNASASDPLAPIRRMSQAEKIALFS
jgi:hypothetical protein